MAEFNVDPDVGLYARRTGGMSASEVRAVRRRLRLEVVSFAGGMPFVQAIPAEHVLEILQGILMEKTEVALQYGGGQRSPALSGRLAC